MGQGDALKLGRRQLLVAGAMGLAGGVAGCDAPPPMLQGGFTGAAHERGHWLRQPLPQASTAPATIRRTQVLILGGGVAGLAAARRLQQGGSIWRTSLVATAALRRSRALPARWARITCRRRPMATKPC